MEQIDIITNIDYNTERAKQERTMFLKISAEDTESNRNIIINTDNIIMIEEYNLKTLITLSTNDEIEVNLPLYNFIEIYMKDLIKQPRD